MRLYHRVLLTASTVCVIIIFSIHPLLKQNANSDDSRQPVAQMSRTWNIDLPVLIQPAASKFNSSILVFVTSTPDHSNRRQAIRETWGTIPMVKVIFILGVSRNDNASNLQHDINFESELYGDMLQLNFVDVYRNLTLKSIALVQWAKTSRWPARRLVIKTDDDAFVNTPRLLTYLDHFTDGKLYGRQLTGTKPQRCKRSGCSHTEVTKDEYYPDVFPPYLQGLFYVFTETALDRVHEHLFDPPFVFIEDLYITGLVAGRAGVDRCPMPKDNVINDVHPDYKTLGRFRNDLLVQHHCEPSRQRRYWGQVHP